MGHATLKSAELYLRSVPRTIRQAAIESPSAAKGKCTGRIAHLPRDRVQKRLDVARGEGMAARDEQYAQARLKESWETVRVLVSYSVLRHEANYGLFEMEGRGHRLTLSFSYEHPIR
jgi:hypothetical protein